MEPLFELRLEPARKGARDAAVTLYRQLRDAILDGRLAAGSRLPPTRSAGARLSVSRNTAADVYDRLALEGLVLARPGSGTFVAELATDARDTAAAAPPVTIDPRVNSVWTSQATRRATGYWQNAAEEVAHGGDVIDLRPALVDTRLFPFDRLRQAFTATLRRMERGPARNRPPAGNQGNLQLRSAIAAHVALTRAVAVRADGILVTSGAQQAFDLLARVLVRPGETIVAVEDPGYPPMRVPFAAAGAVVVGVPVDEEGIRVDLIPPGAAVVCVTPSHQFPLGVPLSPVRRATLLRFATATGCIVVEDDYDGEFRYDGSPATALRTADAGNVVFYVGTFSKTMLPSLRLGFLIPPAWALASLVAAKNASDWHASSPLQAGVAGFIGAGHLARHVARMRRVYGDRRRALLGSIAANLPADVRALPSCHGMHLTLVSEEDRDMERVAALAAASGLQMHGLTRYHLGEPRVDGLVIGFGAAERDRLVQAMELLGVLLRTG